MACYRKGGCGPYEYMSCTECPYSKPRADGKMLLRTVPPKCDFCTGGKPLYHAEDHGMAAVIDIVGKTLVVDLYSDYAEVPLTFCPVCGRKLEE